MQEILAGLGIWERGLVGEHVQKMPISVKSSWEVRAPFWAFLGKAATRGSTTWVHGGSAETALLERSHAQVGKWEKKGLELWQSPASRVCAWWLKTRTNAQTTPVLWRKREGTVLY